MQNSIFRQILGCNRLSSIRFRLIGCVLLSACCASAYAASGTEQYSYDALGRLTKVSVPGGPSTCYFYDSAGNRKTSGICAADLKSQISVSSNGATALAAAQGGSGATGAIVFANSGTLAAALTFSGLSAPYSVSPSTCNAAANVGTTVGTCTVTVTMTTSGAVGPQSSQTLTATGGSNGPVTAMVAGSLSAAINSSAIGLSTNGGARGGAAAMLLLLD